MRFDSDEWPSNPDDLLDSLFLNDGFLSDFDGNINFNDLPSTVVKDRISPDLSTEPEFHGFVNDMNHKPVNDVSEYINYSANNQSTSSNGSDSGLSSDNMDNMEVDISPDYEPLSPALSSPGPSISERGGQNSPPRTACIQPMRQPMKPKSTIIAASSSKVVGKHQPMPSNIRTAVQQKKEVKIYKMTPATQVVTAGSTNKKVTIQMKDSPIAVKSQSTGKFVINKQNPNVQGVRKLIRVQNPSNPRSILLPVSFQDVKDFRTIKIINASSLNNKSSNIKMAAANLLQQSKKGLVPKNVLVSKEQLIDDSMSDHTSDAESYVFDDVMMTSSSLATPSETGNNSDSSDSNHETQSSYPKLTLTNEEKRLLAKEGISLPGNYPLTKHEERELKRIRRKIRNKISAQDSRKRKKEYVDGLEERVKQCTDENQTLIKRIKQLQSQNHNLMSQMKKLQTLLTKGTSKTAQPATCLMVLLLSLALVAVPNLRLGQNPKDTELTDVLEESLLQKGRSLLFDTKQQFGDALVDEEMNLDDILAFNDQVSEHNYAADVESIVSGVSMAKKPRTFIEFDVDDKIWKPPANAASDFDGKAKEFHDQRKSSHSSGFNIDQPTNDDLLSTQPKELYEMKLDTISSFAKGGAEVEIMHDKVMIGDSDEERKKLNASQISGSERKILMKGA
ncbi:hypothetical protein HA402_001784 [Bradysia odoriphaga]|nr:hypothetical protein HA402_001784 [Bradysia odoriphaga]